jgi:lambda family phage tail tape measure protein
MLFARFATGASTAKQAFGDMARSMISWMAQMAAQKAFMQLFGYLLSSVSFGGGGSAAGATTLSNGATVNASGVVYGMANGGVLPGGFQAFANGGTATSPTLGLVGEGKYNEAIVPLPDGKSIPVDMKGGGDNININNTFNFSGGQGNEQDQRRMGNMIAGQIKEQVRMAIKDEKRFGGVLNRQYQGA